MFKPVDLIGHADPLVARTSGRDGTAPLTVEEQHDWVAAIQLRPTVPEEVRRSFDTARNAFVYAWFSYDLGALAEAQAYTSVELALRLRLGPRAHEKDTISPLLEKAVNDGLLQNPPSGPPLAFSLRLMRNDRAHPTDTVLSPVLTVGVLELCAGLINELFS